MSNIKPLARDVLSSVTGGRIQLPDAPWPPKPDQPAQPGWPTQPTKPWTPPTLA